MSITTPSTSTTSASPANAALDSSPAPSLARLTAVELRKSVDTRGGRWFFAVLALLAAAALGYRLVTADEPLTFERAYSAPVEVVQLLLPVFGVLVMTAEWTHRTVLTTFTLTPRRGRVVAAKFAAVLIVALTAGLLVAAAAAATALVAGSATGAAVSWDGAARLVGGAAVASALAMLLGAGLGALLQQTASALVVYFLAPVMIAIAGNALLADGVLWVAILTTLADVRDLDLTGALAPTLTSIALWIALPLAAGVVRTVRREVS